MRCAIFAMMLAWCSPAWAIAFVFQTENVTGGNATLDILVELDTVSDFFVNANDPGPSPFIISQGPFRRLVLAYSFDGGSEFSQVTPNSYLTNNPASDQITFQSFGANVGLGHADCCISAFGGSSSGFLGDWLFEIGSDNPLIDRPTVTGRFIAVPEPSASWLLLIGSVFCLRSRNRKTMQRRCLTAKGLFSAGKNSWSTG